MSTLYEHAGGAPALLALATAHHRRCLADPELNHPFSHDDLNPEHVARLAAYWGEVFGGPASGLEHAEVLRMHAGNGDMTEMGRRFHACFLVAMDDAGLPGDPAFRATMSDYMRWAVDEVLGYDDPSVELPAAAPVPRWGWAGLE